MSLIRPSGQPSAAPQTAGTGTAGGTQPVNLFAALVQKLLGELGGGKSAAAAAEVPVQASLFFAPKGGSKSGAAAPVTEGDAGPAKSQSKKTSGDLQVVADVQQPGLMQVLNIAPAGTAGAAVLPAIADNADGSTPAGAAPAGPGVSFPAGNPVTGVSRENSPQPASSAGQFASPDAGTGTLLSFFKNISTFGTRAPLPAGSPFGNLAPDKGARVQQDPVPDQTLTPELAVLPDKSATPALAFDAEQSAATPPEMHVQSPFVPVAASPGAPAPVAATPAMALGAELNTVTPDLSNEPAQVTGPAPAQVTQVQPPAQMIPVVPALTVVAPEVVDPVVLPRFAVVQPRKGVDSISRFADDSVETDSAPPGGETAPARAGFFTSIVSDVLGIVSRGGSKSASSDPQGDAAAQVPVEKAIVVSGDPAPAFADVQVQALKKVSDGPVQDPGAVSGADVARPAHEQVDLTALRSGQVVQSGQSFPEKPDGAGTTAPLRDVPSPYAPLPAEVSRRIADQVVQNLRLQVDGTTSDIRMTLRPPSLGEVQLSVHVEDAKMQAQINVTQQVVKSALEAHMPQLRQALQDHGIEVQRIDVMLPEASLQHDGAGANGERAGRRGGRRVLASDDTEEYREAKDMGYNTIELLM